MKSPIITVIGSLSFASGCLIVASCVDKLTAGSILLARTISQNHDAPLVVNQLTACLTLAWPVLLLVSLAGFITFWIAEKRLIALIMLILPLLAVAYSVWRLPRPEQGDLWYLKNAGNIECICRIDAIEGSNALLCTPLELRFPAKRKLQGKLLVTIYGANHRPTNKPNKLNFQPNQRLSILGRVAQIQQTQSSWQRNDRRKLVSSGIFSKLSTDPGHIKVLPDRNDNTGESVSKNEQPTRSFVKRATDGWQDFWQRGRQEIIKSHANSLGADKGDLLSSMVLGDRVVHLPKDIKDLFRSVGLSHLLAASGFNLSIVVASSFFLARLLPLRPQYASLFALLSTASFVFLAGPSPSVVRAAVLCVFFLTAKLFSRKLHSLAALSFTLLLALLCDPLCASDVGLQLSYLATAGIISGLQWVGREKPKGLIERVTRWFRDTISVICLAQLAVLPLQVYYFQNAGILFLPANLLVDPIVAPVTVLGFLSSMLAFAFSLLPIGIAGSTTVIEVIDKLTSFSLDYMIQCATLLASLKGTTIHMGPPVPFALPLYYICLSYFLYVLPNKHMRSFGLIVLLGGLCLLMFRPDIPREVVYFSKQSALTITTGKAYVLNDDSPDWLGKQLLAYCGVNEIKPRTENRKQLHFEIKSRQNGKGTVPIPPTRIKLIETAEFCVVARGSQDGKADTPLTYGETKKVLGRLDSDDSLPQHKPILVWTKGHTSAVQRCKYSRNRDIYIAFVNSRSPLVVARRQKTEASSDATRTEDDPQRDTERTNRTAGQSEKEFGDQDGGTFYPFQIAGSFDQLLVLR
jgi:ComEC/Rec2-related protein